MKTAIVISGNLRTFLMPVKEHGNARLCDLFINNIVNHNKSDVFIFTDTNDFYYNGTQYFVTDKKIEVLNNDTSRLHDKVDFLDHNLAKSIITNQLSIFGNSLKNFVIEKPFNANADPKLDQLKSEDIKGNNPLLLIQQVRKTKLAYELLSEYERNNNIKYDLVLRWRFDNSINGQFNFLSHDFTNYDIYVPGIHSPVIYDWFALGTRDAMSKCFSIYDFVGTFLKDGRIYICSKCKYYGDIKTNPHMCHKDRELYEITLSVEYHLFRIFSEHKIKLCNTSYQSCPYRYRKSADELSIEKLMGSLNIDATVVSYSPGVEINETKYQKK